MRNRSITGRLIAEVAAVILTAALAITWMVTTDAKLNPLSARAADRTVVECGSSCDEATLRQLIKDAGTPPPGLW